MLEPKPPRKARTRFRRAYKSFVAAQRADTFKEFEDAWDDFLIHSDTVFEQIKATCAKDQKLLTWHGERQAVRRKDPLLKYLWEARNANEHSVQTVSSFRDAEYAILPPRDGSPFTLNGVIGGPNTNFTLTSHGAEPPRVWINQPTVIVLPVRARDGQIYNPPTTHLGERLAEGSPLEIAYKALKFMDKLITEFPIK